jgi:hypothetical protein
MTFQLSDPQGTDASHATATATVIAVTVHPGWYGGPA